MSRRRRERVARDQGFTLSELLVSVVVFGMVGAIVTTASVTGLHKQTQAQNRDDELAQMRTALQRIDRDTRSAYPLLAASSTQLVLREVQTGVTRVMTYSISGTTLLVNETDTTSNGTTSSAPQRTLLTNVVPTLTRFTFTPTTGYVAPANGGVNATTCVMNGSAIDPGCVGTITVQVSTQPEYIAAPITLSDNGVVLRNAT